MGVKMKLVELDLVATGTVWVNVDRVEGVTASVGQPGAAVVWVDGKPAWSVRGELREVVRLLNPDTPFYPLYNRPADLPTVADSVAACECPGCVDWDEGPELVNPHARFTADALGEPYLRESPVDAAVAVMRDTTDGINELLGVR